MEDKNTIDYLENPHQVYSNMLSAQRNMFVTSTLGITLFGLSYTLKFNLLFKIMSVILLFFSIWISHLSSRDYNYYLFLIEKNHKNTRFYHWKNWSYISRSYLILMIILVIFIIKVIIQKK